MQGPDRGSGRPGAGRVAGGSGRRRRRSRCTGCPGRCEPAGPGGRGEGREVGLRAPQDRPMAATCRAWVAPRISPTVGGSQLPVVPILSRTGDDLSEVHQTQRPAGPRRRGRGDERSPRRRRRTAGTGWPSTTAPSPTAVGPVEGGGNLGVSVVIDAGPGTWTGSRWAHQWASRITTSAAAARLALFAPGGHPTLAWCSSGLPWSWSANSGSRTATVPAMAARSPIIAHRPVDGSTWAGSSGSRLAWAATRSTARAAWDPCGPGPVQEEIGGCRAGHVGDGVAAQQHPGRGDWVARAAVTARARAVGLARSWPGRSSAR